MNKKSSRCCSYRQRHSLAPPARQQAYPPASALAASDIPLVRLPTVPVLPAIVAEGNSDALPEGGLTGDAASTPKNEGHGYLWSEHVKIVESSGVTPAQSQRVSPLHVHDSASAGGSYSDEVHGDLTVYAADGREHSDGDGEGELGSGPVFIEHNTARRVTFGMTSSLVSQRSHVHFLLLFTLVRFWVSICIFSESIFSRLLAAGLSFSSAPDVPFSTPDIPIEENSDPRASLSVFAALKPNVPADTDSSAPKLAPFLALTSFDLVSDEFRAQQELVVRSVRVSFPSTVTTFSPLLISFCIYALCGSLCFLTFFCENEG